MKDKSVKQGNIRLYSQRGKCVRKPFPFRAVGCGALVAFLVLVVACAVFLRPGDVPMDGNWVRMKVGAKGVSHKASAYLQQESDAAEAFAEFCGRLLADIEQGNAPVFEDYEEIIDTVILEIDAMEEKSIKKSSPLKIFELTCEAYWGVVKRYFMDMKVKQHLSFEAYDTLCAELVGLQTPEEHLVELFDENNVFYHHENGKIIYEVSSQSVL